jgi:kynurenine formamidase
VSATAFDGYPAYVQLPVLAPTGARHAWGVFGDSDELGTLNWITPESVVAAAATVAVGRVVNLSLPLTVPDPPLVPSRKAMSHVVVRSRGGRDDRLDNFYLQTSSQWDGLQHVRYREHGYWGGRDDETLDSGALGIDRIARHGVVGRGVLVDVSAFMSAVGSAVDPTMRVVISPSTLDEVLAWEGIALNRGDIVLIRTGWMAWYLKLTHEDRASLAGRLHTGDDGLNTPGLDPEWRSAEWIWNHRLAAVAADNPALEALKVDRSVGFLHRLLIPLLGLTVGELWDLEELSEACRTYGRYSFFITSAPLNLPSGVGSPANAYAIF